MFLDERWGVGAFLTACVLGVWSVHRLASPSAPSQTQFALMFALATIFGFWVGGRMSRSRRELAYDEIERALSPVLVRAQFPHVIAHSFGTFALFRLLHRDETIRLRRLVFVGSVLSPRTDFRVLAIPLAGEPRVRGIHNSHGTRDFAVRFLGWLRWFRLVPSEFGSAGVHGFKQVAPSGNTVAPYQVHNGDTEGDLPRCDGCANGDPRSAWLHNWRHSGGHSTRFYTPHTLQSHWYAELWELPLSEYAELLKIVRQYHSAIAAEDYKKADTYLEEMLDTAALWTNNEKLSHHLTRYLTPRDKLAEANLQWRYGGVEGAKKMVVGRMLSVLANALDRRAELYSSDLKRIEDLPEISDDDPIWGLKPAEALRTAITEIAQNHLT
jgi:hypothetical protein